MFVPYMCTVAPYESHRPNTNGSAQMPTHFMLPVFIRTNVRIMLVTPCWKQAHPYPIIVPWPDYDTHVSG